MQIEISPPLAAPLMESIRAIGYTAAMAVADVIDNSVSAAADEVDVLFVPSAEPYLVILDNGYGMSLADLKNAMRYGSRNPQEGREGTDLGRFGLGLKTASLSQCRQLTVISKQHGSVAACRWDLDYVQAQGNWALQILDATEWGKLPHVAKLSHLTSGTLVLWQNLDRLVESGGDRQRLFSKAMDDVREHLRLVFHRYIEGEAELQTLKLRMNGMALSAIDPLLRRRSARPMADEFLAIDDAKILVRPFLLPHVSQLSAAEIKNLGGKEGLRQGQGFYVYRHKRLVIWATWFRMIGKAELSKLVRIQVDIPNNLDHLWALDIKKATAMPPALVREQLQGIIEKLAACSERSWTIRGRKAVGDNNTVVWQRLQGREGGVYYQINRQHPMLAAWAGESGKLSLSLEALLSMIESHLPLQQLHVDLNKESNTWQNRDIDEQMLENILKNLLGQSSDNRRKSELLNKLAMAEPFNRCPKLIEQYRRLIG
ncbi:ATP-binding protein [Stenoxybacter acetivorans]|uniref:ATP-binding protein n=1 Tax=Stenoxybacter acetivorans TaxID=422441 RepID=UPI000561E04C|nr:ATP-binding protein [Stenoxybacter acetivorans]